MEYIMPFCITLDKNGKEVFRESTLSRVYPKDGWERKKDGNFYKKLDDPRCISFQQKKLAIVQQQKKPEVIPIKIVEEDETQNFTPLDFSNTKIAKTPTTIEMILFSAYNYGKTEQNGIIYLHSPCMSGTCGLSELNLQSYAKIAICKLTKDVKVWFTNKQKTLPDLYILNAIA